jgi:glycosyl-4,4'-diaponeurosporenoate acyltransferase
MRIELPMAWVIVLNVGGWPAIQMGLAWAFTRLPPNWFNPSNAFSWERGGRFYEVVFGVKRWKDRLPDAARWFGGGFAKAALAEKNPDYLQRFIQETWRGELCHWAAMACAPLFFLWNPWWGDLIIVAYALGANLPCILAQRYNRARLQKLLVRKKDHGPQAGTFRPRRT